MDEGKFVKEMAVKVALGLKSTIEQDAGGFTIEYEICEGKSLELEFDAEEGSTGVDFSGLGRGEEIIVQQWLQTAWDMGWKVCKEDVNK